MVIAALSGAAGAVIFGTTGWLGKLVSVTCFGTAERHDDGPLPVAVPAWAFVAAPACIGAVVGFHEPQPFRVAILLIAVFSLTVCAATDLRTGLIPDLCTLVPLILVLAVAAVRRDWAAPVGALFALGPFAALAAISRGRGMGWGDVKLAVLGGALVGMAGITLAVALAAIAASIVAATGGPGRRPIAFGPYLAASIAVALGLASSF